jgi:hypothetical protein
MLVDNRPVEVLAILPTQAEKVRKEDSSNKSVQYIALGIFSAAALVGIYYGRNYLSVQPINEKNVQPVNVQPINEESVNEKSIDELLKSLPFNDEFKFCLAKCYEKSKVFFHLYNKKIIDCNEEISNANNFDEKMLVDVNCSLLKKGFLSNLLLHNIEFDKCQTDCIEEYNRMATVKI